MSKNASIADKVAQRSALHRDDAPLSKIEARALFSPYAKMSCLALAVSGGPDSMALLWLAAKWRAGRKTGPALIVLTVDHGLRPQAKAEARLVARMAAQLGLSQRTLRWRGEKPAAGIQAAARDARYHLMGRAARKAGASHLLTAHTLDDQAETILFRMARGSGLRGLAGMHAETKRDGVVLARPLLEVPKTRLIATLRAAQIPFAEDASNRDAKYTRVRWRALMPPLALEGLDAKGLGRFARRMKRADDALQLYATEAQTRLCTRGHQGDIRIAREAFAALPDEIALRLLANMIAALTPAGSVADTPRIELGKLEALHAVLMRAVRQGDGRGPKSFVRQTLAGASIALNAREIVASLAPQRRAPKSAAHRSRNKA